MRMAPDGFDMLIGGKLDPLFGPVVVFGFGGIYVEVLADVEIVMCPSNRDEIEKKLKRLKSYRILSGIRGQKQVDIEGFIEIVERVTHLMDQTSRMPGQRIEELDLNPVRLLSDGSGAIALDARMRLGNGDAG